MATEPFLTWILKEQFSNLAPWNMPDLSLFTARLSLFFLINIKKEVKRLELALVARTFAEGLTVNDILR